MVGGNEEERRRRRWSFMVIFNEPRVNGLM